jgi:hypothetical protein
MFGGLQDFSACGQLGFPLFGEDFCEEIRWQVVGMVDYRGQNPDLWLIFLLHPRILGLDLHPVSKEETAPKRGVRPDSHFSAGNDYYCYF